MKGKVIFLAAAMGTLWSAAAFGAQFPDVPTDHWAYNEVVKASEISFISGMDDGTFGLGQTVTRGAVCIHDVQDVWLGTGGCQEWFFCG